MKTLILSLDNFDNTSLWASIDSNTMLVVPKSVYSNIKFSSVVFINKLKKLNYTYRLIENNRDWNIFFDL